MPRRRSTSLRSISPSQGLYRQPFSTTTDASAGWLPTPLLQNLRSSSAVPRAGRIVEHQPGGEGPGPVGLQPLVERLLHEDLRRSRAGQTALGASRIWFSPRAANVPLTDAAFQRLASRSAQLGRPCLVVSSPEGLTETDAPPPASWPVRQRRRPSRRRTGEGQTPLLPTGRTRLRRLLPRRRMAAGDRSLGAGWQATVNGREQAVSSATSSSVRFPSQRDSITCASSTGPSAILGSG